MVGIRDVVRGYFRFDPEKAVQDLRRSSLNKGNSIGRIGFKRGADKQHGSDMDLVVQDAKGWGTKVGQHYVIQVHGKKLTLCNDPLYIFRAENPSANNVRRIAVWITEWYWCEVVITTAIFVNCIIMALPPSYNPDVATPEETAIFAIINVICVILFSVECVLKVIARGLFVGDAPDVCYLQSMSNWFDLIVLSTSIFELLILARGKSTSKLMLMRTFRILRPLRMIDRLPILKMIVGTLADSIPRLIHWLMTTVFVSSIFAILGVSLFGTVYWHRCRLTEAPVVNAAGKTEWPVDPAQMRFCGGRYQCQPTASGAPTYCGYLVDSIDGPIAGIDPWPEINDDPLTDYGFSGFQTFAAALTTIFKVATMEGWTTVMYRFQDGRGDFLALLYFLVLLLFGGLLLLKLAVAILWQSFEAKMRNQLWLDDSNVPADIMKMTMDNLATRVHELEADQKAKSIYQQMDKSTGTLSTIRSISLSIVCTPTFDGVILTVIALNCVVLGCDAYPEPDELIIKLTDQVNLFCAFIFSGEAALRMVSFGFKYFADYFNLFDLALVIVSFVELLFGGSATVSALRVSRLLRLFKVFGHSVPMRVLYRVFRRATVLSCNFCIIVVLVLMGWTLVALHLFFSDNGKRQTQIEFSNFLWAFIAMFQLLCGDRWHEMMVEHARASNEWFTTTWFFTSVFVVCHLVLMNLFLGMFVAAFAIAREEVIHDYRLRMLEFAEIAHQAQKSPKSDGKPRITIIPQEPPEPSWPNGDLRLCDLPKTCTSDMNVAKMIRIKLKASKRATRRGETILLGDASYTPWRYQVVMEPGPGAPSPKPPVTQNRAVSFHNLSIDIPPDDEAAAASSAMLMSMQLHASMPPPLEGLDIIDPLPQTRLSPPPAFDLPDTSAASNLLVLPGSSGSVTGGKLEVAALPPDRKKPSENTPPQPCIQEGGSQEQLITLPRLPQLGKHGLTLVTLPRMTLQGRSADHRYTSIFRGSRTDLEGTNDGEISRESDSGLRRRRPFEVHPTQDVREAEAHATPDFRDAYRKARARARGEDKSKASCSSKLQMQLRAELSRARSDFTRTRTASSHSKSLACRQPEVHASAENARSVRASANLPSKLHLACREDADETVVHEICLPIRDNSRESCGSDREVPARGHLLVPVASHSAPPGPPVTEQERETPLVHEIGPVTMLCQKLVSQPWFDPTILCLIGISSICLAIETPYMDRSSSLAAVLEIADYIIASVFLCEMVAKIGAFGILKPPSNSEEPAYFRSGWNYLDAMVVCSSVVDFASRLFTASGQLFKILRAIRLLRALRPLRLVQRNKGMKVLVEALIKSIPTLLRTLVVTALLYIGFAILFMNLLKGQLWRCSLDPTGELRPDIVTREDCEAAGGEWINARSHFDQIGSAFAAVVHVGTGEGWVEVLQNMVNSVGIDRQPRKNARVEYAFLMIGFVALSNFFLVNLFIGVLIDQYCVVTDIMNGVELSDQAEKQFVAVQKQIFSMPDLLRPAFVIEGFMVKWRTCIARIVQSRYFEAFIFICILINSLFLCLVHPTMSTGLRQTVGVGSTIFIVIFNIEAFMKLFVYKNDYFKDPWNVFDLAIALGADVSLITALTSEGDVVKMLHTFRVVRVLRLVRHFVFLRRQCTALLRLVPAVLNIGLLLVLALFTYACLGVGLFGTIAPGETLNAHANFQSFGMAFLTAIRIMTGEEWHELMYDITSDRPNCTRDLQSSAELEDAGAQGCGTWLAYPYFVSYTCFVSIVMLNLIVAVVLEGYQSVELSTNFECYTAQVRQLDRMWREYDTASSGYLQLDYALIVLTKVPVPVGFKGWPCHRVRHMLRELPLYEERLHFRDVLTVCVKRIYCWLNHCREQDAVSVKLNPQVLEYWYSLYPGIPHPDTSLKSWFVAHAIIRQRIDLYVKRNRHLRMIKAQEDVLKEDENMQLQAKSKGAKAAASLLNQEANTGHKNLGGLNAAGLPLQMPGGDVQGAISEAPEQRAPVSVEELTRHHHRSSGIGLRSSAAPLPWPPPMPPRPERPVEGDAVEFAPCHLVGSGFDTITTAS